VLRRGIGHLLNLGRELNDMSLVIAIMLVENRDWACVRRVRVRANRVVGPWAVGGYAAS